MRKIYKKLQTAKSSATNSIRYWNRKSTNEPEVIIVREVVPMFRICYDSSEVPAGSDIVAQRIDGIWIDS